MTTIGIIGAGKIGAAIATALSRKGIEVTMSNSRSAESLRELTAAIGPLVKPGTREEAASKEIVFVAVPWSKLPAALDGLPNFEGRVVVDTNNPIEAPLFKPIDLGTRASSEVVADLVPGARVVKGFNHLQPHLLSGDPSSEGGKRVLFYSGDELAAKYVVGTLIERLGFFGIDLGSLAIGARLVQFPGGPLPALNLVKFD
ncbi:NAD(P)-binding domain-containing protein [Burkholderia cenocepacia]|uniref:NADPH-dependent F420 reductase n=1 Tax=Burkholderia cepacia complex TaxID=87882 RepID=UPI001B90F9F4|nr:MULTISPECIES: NAD(P)-binding domain-containing protein [Burkholderia cepacia complex]ELW9449476.1 NAD(P)-binding domain-containing protein [Burkholderia cenocepacia]ELW9451683.1 NAD(P)-binding domain-containing protein [Burkholderia cenocepacia]MBR8486364.1 NAD(P)-binding domain-containing protein [Burkholderia cenocepacia]MDN7468723.1 NAD(P)-binding domain-containing protein [Burkholderia orbicola]MDN7506894.1 NAD(P)-binding domain-containing protein [Burkholderia orbicola]